MYTSSADDVQRMEAADRQISLLHIFLKIYLWFLHTIMNSIGSEKPARHSGILTIVPLASDAIYFANKADIKEVEVTRLSWKVVEVTMVEQYKHIGV